MEKSQRYSILSESRQEILTTVISAALDPFLATILWPWVLLWCHAFAVVPWVPNNAPDDAIQAVLMMRRSSRRAPPGPCRSESLRFQPHISKGARDTTAQHRQRRALRSLLHRMGTHQGPQWDTPRVYRATHRFGDEGRNQRKNPDL